MRLKGHACVDGSVLLFGERRPIDDAGSLKFNFSFECLVAQAKWVAAAAERAAARDRLQPEGVAGRSAVGAAGAAARLPGAPHRAQPVHPAAGHTPPRRQPVCAGAPRTRIRGRPQGQPRHAHWRIPRLRSQVSTPACESVGTISDCRQTMSRA